MAVPSFGKHCKFLTIINGFVKARRSLVFATHLRDEGDKFRKEFLQSDDEKDKTPYTEDWQNQVPKEGSAIGGPYLGVHMRRGDFTYAHKETVPSIEELGGEIAKKLKEYKLKKVYLATDGSDQGIYNMICFNTFRKTTK